MGYLLAQLAGFYRRQDGLRDRHRMGRPRRKRMDAGMISTEMIEPLKQGLFSRIWTASLLSNTGRMIQGVGAGWALVEMNGTPEQIGRAHVGTPVTNAHLVCRILL